MSEQPDISYLDPHAPPVGQMGKMPPRIQTLITKAVGEGRRLDAMALIVEHHPDVGYAAQWEGRMRRDH
jgi:hypothetical protein